jgi:hypothetical protein
MHIAHMVIYIMLGVNIVLDPIETWPVLPSNKIFDLLSCSSFMYCYGSMLSI